MGFSFLLQVVDGDVYTKELNGTKTSKSVLGLSNSGPSNLSWGIMLSNSNEVQYGEGGKLK